MPFTAASKPDAIAAAFSQAGGDELSAVEPL